MELFSDNDIAAEILSRLPVRSLVAFKCTDRRWYSFVSDPLFLRIHYQRSKDVTGLIMMQNIVSEGGSYTETKFDSIDLLTPTETGYTLNYKALDFLPEKVIILSSSKGILCCRSWVDQELRARQKETVTYICNPFTRKWVQFRCKLRCNVEGQKHRYGLIPGFAFYPSSGAASMFKLVNIIYNKWNSYSFDIYSSETKKWKTSKEVCKTNHVVCTTRVYNYPQRVIFTNGWLHWLTVDYLIVAFHVEEEISKLIKLPCAPPFTLGTYEFGIFCWGESEGHFHFVLAHEPELQVWVLKNYEEEEEPAWELKYCLNMAQFRDQHSSLRKNDRPWLDVLTFHEDVLYFRPCKSGGILVSYNFKTKTLIDHGEIARESAKDPNSTVVFPFSPTQHCPIVVPFSASLLPLHELLPFGERCSKRNRKRKLLEK